MMKRTAKKTAAKKPIAKPEKTPDALSGKADKTKYVRIETPDFWIARDKNDATSGFLLFDKKTGEYHASVEDFKLHFRQINRGNFNDQRDSPIDEFQLPKGELLLLLALRERYIDLPVNANAMKYLWRMMAIKKLLDEIEATTGKSNTDKKVKKWQEIAKDDMLFEKHIGQWLVMKIKEEGAGDFLIRMGNWINRAQCIESPDTDKRRDAFFRSVELAARETGTVPTQKEVKKYFEKMPSIGRTCTTFDSIKAQLCFGWLPMAVRGKKDY